MRLQPSMMMLIGTIMLAACEVKLSPDLSNNPFKGQESESGDSTNATEANNPADEECGSKPCYKLHLRDLKSIGNKVVIKVSNNGSSQSYQVNLDSQTTAALNIDGGEAKVSVKIINKKGKVVPHSKTEKTVSVNSEEPLEETAFYQDVFTDLTGSIGFKEGNIDNVDQAFLDRLTTLKEKTFQAVSPNPTKRFPGEYSLASYTYEKRLTYDLDLGDASQATVTKDGRVFAVDNHELYEIDEAGKKTEIRIAPELDISWLSGITYDSKRNRLILSASHVDHALATYDLETKEWKKIEIDLGYRVDSIALPLYLEQLDAIFFLSSDSESVQLTMRGMDAETEELKYHLRLPPTARSAGYFIQESISFGRLDNFIAMVFHPNSRGEDDEGYENDEEEGSDTEESSVDSDRDSLIYVFDPENKRMVLTKSASWQEDLKLEKSKNIGSCKDSEGTESNYVRTDGIDPNDPLVAVIGHYEPGKTVTKVKLPKADRPWTLVLLSYEWTEWEIELAEGASLDRVIASGYEKVSVTGQPSEIKAEISFYDDESEDDLNGPLLPSIYQWEANSESDYISSIEKIRTHLKLKGKEKLFMGCYSSKKFDVGSLLDSQN